MISVATTETPETMKELINRIWDKYKERYKNPMRIPRIYSVVINCSLGESGEPLERARKILEELTDRKLMLLRAKKTIRPFGIHKNQAIGWKVTLRGEQAYAFLRRVLKVYDNTLWSNAIDNNGNFSFGIDEHIKIPGVKYDPKLGTIGFDVCVSMERPGYRVKRRRLRRSKIPSRHRLTKEDTKIFLEMMNIKIKEGKKAVEEFGLGFGVGIRRESIGEKEQPKVKTKGKKAGKSKKKGKKK